ncbi:MAG: DegT/DnrJ/EryC1/StrS family aminotransferase [Acidimicrobiales bacterium]|nr:DegT/DnrJ/EryC1/StrS family aminotransferase [Acidimicrobiales bacterium]
MDHLAAPDARGIRLARPDVGDDELAAIAEVFRSGILTDGPATAAFEAAFAARHDVEHAVAFASGTVALAAIHLGLGIGPGDEVIVPSMTFISTATSVLHVGATPVFADILPDTFDLDPADVARRITPATKAIVAVHYGGQAADLDGLRAVADDAGVLLVEDAAEAHGATYHGRPVGGFGRAAMFSFTPTKNITTGEGGMVTTDDGDLAEQLRLLRNHGQPGPGHHVLVGYNWRLSEMQAAMGNAQLAKLPGILERKQAHARRLTELLSDVPGITPPAVRPGCGHVYMLYTLLVAEGRDELRDALAERRIETRVYFPPAHLQPIFAPARTDLPVTDEVARHMLSVPIHAQLPSSDIDEVARAIVDLLP